jgi:hypothetical protein
MPRVGFEHKIPVFERVKTVHALGLVATVIGYGDQLRMQNVGTKKLEHILSYWF